MTNPTATIFVPYHSVDDLIQRGTRAAQPDAADVTPGTLYGVTDQGNIVERSTGTVWEPYGAAPGGAATILEYRYATSTTPPPSNSQIELDAAHPFTAVTHLYVHVSPTDGSDAYWALMLIAPGQVLNIQDKTDHTKYVSLTVTGAPIDNGGVYVDLPVSWRANGTAISNQAVVLMRIAAAGGVAAHHTTHEPGGADALVNAAWTDVANVFTANQTVMAVAPTVRWIETGQPPNARAFQVFGSNQNLLFWAIDDAGGLQAIPLALSRTGDTRVGRDLYEKDRTTALGHWVDQPFYAFNFTANAGGGTWTVGAAAVHRNRYTLIGKTLHWSLYISWFSGSNTIAGTVTKLGLTMPAGLTAVTAQVERVAVGVDGSGQPDMNIEMMGAYVTVGRNDGAAFPAGAVGLITTMMMEIL